MWAFSNPESALAVDLWVGLPALVTFCSRPCLSPSPLQAAVTMPWGPVTLLIAAFLGIDT